MRRNYRLLPAACLVGALVALPVAGIEPSSASKVLYSTYLGELWTETAPRGAVDSKGNLYVALLEAGIEGGEIFNHHDLALFDKRGKLRKRIRIATRDTISHGFVGLAPDFEAGRVGAPTGAVKGAVIVAMTVEVADLPVLDPIQTGLGTSAANDDVYVAAYSLDLETLLFATYFGGGDRDTLLDADVTPDGRIVLVGNTASRDFLLAQPTQRRRLGSVDGFVSVIDLRAATAGAGTALPFSTYLGGREKKKATGFLSEESVRAVDIDSLGRIHVVGSVNSKKKFPLVSPLRDRLSGTSDAFLTVFDLGARPRIVFSTLFGGTKTDQAVDVDTDRDGRSVIAGHTTSVDYPLVDPVQETLAGPADPFVTVIDSGLSASASSRAPALMPFSTLLGGSVDEARRLGILVDRNGYIHLAGTTASPDFPVVGPLQEDLSTPDPGSIDRCFADGELFDCGDLFLARFSPLPRTAAGVRAAPELEFSTFWGGGGWDALTDLVVDGRGAAHLVGTTTSRDFRLHKAGQKRLGGGRDLALVKIAR